MLGKDNVHPAAVRQTWVGSVRRRVIVLAIGVLFVAGCGDPYSERPSLTGSDRLSAVAPQQQLPVATDPHAVLFVAFHETPQDVVERMLKMARMTKDDVVCDLGCGDGRIVVAAAKRYGCRAIGYDLDPLRVEEARKNAERNGVAHLVTIEQKDVLTVDLEGVSVVTIYMGTEMNARLIPQLSRLQAGARIVSHEFELGEIPPERTVEMTSRESGHRHKIHLWTCPLAKTTAP
jgi:SAM-dependent methyltransferase